MNQAKEEFITARPYMVKAETALQKARAAFGTSGRWGETRRFAGRSAGLRLERMSKAEARWSKAWDRAEKEWAKTTEGRA